MYLYILIVGVAEQYWSPSAASGLLAHTIVCCETAGINSSNADMCQSDVDLIACSISISTPSHYGFGRLADLRHAFDF